VFDNKFRSFEDNIRNKWTIKVKLHIKNTLEPHNFGLKEEKCEDMLALVNEEL